jgi:hypothetical protein
MNFQGGLPLPRWPPSLEVSSRPALYQDALPCWGYRRPVRSLPALTDTAVNVANRGRAYAAKRHPPLLASLVYPRSFPTCDGRGPPGGLIQGRRLRAVWPSAVPSRFATHRACGVPERRRPVAGAHPCLAAVDAMRLRMSPLRAFRVNCVPTPPSSDRCDFIQVSANPQHLPHDSCSSRERMR